MISNTWLSCTNFILRFTTVRDKPILKTFHLKPIYLLTALLINLMIRRTLFEQQVHAKIVTDVIIFLLVNFKPPKPSKLQIP